MEAAATQFAERGPGEVSLRDIAEVVGCSQPLISRSFGSKAGLEMAVVERLAERLASVVVELGLGAEVSTTSGGGDRWPFAALIEHLEHDPVSERLLVRCALGELPDAPLVFPGNIAQVVSGVCAARREHGRNASDEPGDAATFAAFASLCLLFGWIALDGFLVQASRLTATTRAVRARKVAQACEYVASFCLERTGELEFPRRRPRRTSRVADPQRIRGVEAVHDALIRAVIAALGTPGPAKLSTRDLASQAGVNQGQIYHLFGSREALLDEAITVSSTPFAEVAIREGVIDLAQAARARRESEAPIVIARLLANGVETVAVRSSYPVFDALLARYPRIPTGAVRGGLADPRIATLVSGAFHQGSVVWEPLLRRMLAIPEWLDLDPAAGVIIRALPDLAPTAAR